MISSSETALAPYFSLLEAVLLMKPVADALSKKKTVHKYLLICVCTPTARLHGQQRQGHHHHHPGLGLAMHAARLPPCVETEVTGVAPRCPSA
jgi:hypothetical protein